MNLEFFPFAAIGTVIAFLMGSSIRNVVISKAISSNDIHCLPGELRSALAKIQACDNDEENDLMNASTDFIYKEDAKASANLLRAVCENGKPLTFRFDTPQFLNFCQYLNDPEQMVPSVRDGFLCCFALNIFGDNAPAIDLTRLNWNLINQFVQELFKSHNCLVREIPSVHAFEITIQPDFIRYLLSGPELVRELKGGESSFTSFEDEDLKGALRAPTVYSETDEDDEILIVKQTPAVIYVEKPIPHTLGDNGASSLAISSYSFAAVSLLLLIAL